MSDNLKLPLDNIEVMDDDLMFVLGGAGKPDSTTASGSGCGCGCNGGAGCGCGCTSGAGCGCNCEGGKGCGCGCETTAPPPPDPITGI